MSDSLPAAVPVEGAKGGWPVRLQRVHAWVRGLLGADRALALAGTAVVGHFALGLPWPLGFLLAGLVVVTRPTPGSAAPFPGGPGRLS
jgi:hypothetical protein